MADKVDVIVIGAGLSGLQAALDLCAEGRSVLILEARDRVGGKTYSTPRPDGKGIQELGAAWLNDTNQSHVWSYCKRFNLTPVVQNIQGSVACEDANGSSHLFPFDGLPNFLKADLDNIIEIRQKVEQASLDPTTFEQPSRTALDNLTFEQWLVGNGANKKALLTARLWCRGTLGQDPGEISALVFLEIARGALGVINLRFDGKHGAQYIRLREGTQAISIGMAKLLPPNSIRLNDPVISVFKETPKQFLITTASGLRIRATKVIVSVPTPAYKNITFNPPLPARKQNYIFASRYGCYVKFICLFKTPFWRRAGGCGLAQSFRGPINHCRDTSVDADDNYALTCFIVSTPGRKWLALDDASRLDAVLKQLANLFGVKYEDVKDEYLGNIVSPWAEDKWAGWGCPFTATPPGVTGDIEDGELTKLKADGLYFIGTELTDEWRGYMEGAIRSGIRGAKQVSDDLRKGESVL